jgi:hypothetical protein
MSVTIKGGVTKQLPRHRGGLADGMHICGFEIASFHKDILATISRSLREGVPVTTLDGFASIPNIDGMALINENRINLERLNRNFKNLEARARNLRLLAADETDQQSRTEYQEDARRESKRLTEMKVEIDRLSNQEIKPLPIQFTSETEYLIAGLSALVSSDTGRIQLETATAFQSILHEFQVEAKGDRVHWSTCLLVPADGRVVVIGPFKGSVPAIGRKKSPADLDSLNYSLGAGISRRSVVSKLQDAGFSYHRSRAASLAPGGYLARVLLGEEVIWPQCNSDFNHERFNSHVRQIWSKNFSCSKTFYCWSNPKRQAVTDIVSNLGGRAYREQIWPLLKSFEIEDKHLIFMTQEIVSTRQGALPWPPSVVRLGEWNTGEDNNLKMLGSVFCQLCGNPATAVIRVPEVSDSVLCRSCCVMPSQPDLPFPRMYLDLALPETDLDQALLARARSWKPSYDAENI